jgi:hypothetical protein
MLDGLLRFSLDKAIEMAALALRVECSFSPPRSKDGDIPSYFRLENYLPSVCFILGQFFI